MAPLRIPTINLRKVWPIVLGIAVLVVLGYYLPKVWKAAPEFFRQMPAALQKPTEEEKKPEEKLKLEEIPLESVEGLERRAEKGRYLETAAKGEGITHLARRVLKRYLQENPQNFEVTPEHKIYIEDYIAKSLGGRWLKIGEEVEFSQGLIEEALAKAQNLSPIQLQNLTQYSQLVPSL